MKKKQKILFFHDNYVLGGDTHYLVKILKYIPSSEFTLIFGSSHSVKKFILNSNIDISSLIELRLFNRSKLLHIFKNKCDSRFARYIVRALLKIFSTLLDSIAYIRLKKIMKYINVDEYSTIVVNSGGFWGSEMSQLFLKCLKNNKCTYIIHNHIPQAIRSGNNGFFSISQYVNEWITGSKVIEKQLINDYKINPMHVHYIPYGIDPQITPIDVKRQKLRDQLGIPQNYFVILHPSSFEKRKGHYFLLTAFRDFKRKVKYSKLILAGDEGDYKKIVENIVKKYELDNDVLFTGYYTPLEELIIFSDLVCLPSQDFDTTPLVLLLSLGCKTPILTTNREDIKPFLSDGHNALLVDVNDSETITKKILKLYKNKPLKNKLISNGYLTYKKYFTEASMIANTIKIIKQ